MITRAAALCLMLTGLTFGSVWAQDSVEETEQEPEVVQNIVGNVVVLRALDKVTATTKDYTIKVGESLNYGSLRVDVKHCEKKPPEEIPQTWAFLQMFDTRISAENEEAEPTEGSTAIIIDEDGHKREKVFSGWMLAERPAISALEHPVYDVWVLECRRS